MKQIVTLILIFTIANTAGIVIAQQCPVEWFTAEFSLIADRTVPATTREAQFDTNLTFFRDVLKFTPAEIESATQNAIEFFISRYGLDFSTSQLDALGQRHFQNATMFPLQAPVPFIATYNRWLATGSTKSECFRTTLGGYTVFFTGEQMLHGSYGGENGLPAVRLDSIAYNYYSIELCPQQPLVIQLQSTIPRRPDPIDGYSTIKSELFHRTLGEGVELGVTRFTPTTEDRSMIRFEYRSVQTFPAYEETP